MMNWISKTIWLTSVTLLAIAGCEQEQKQEQKVDVSAPKPPYISRAVEATGGLQLWTKTQRLEFDCVVAFYQPDGSFYLTEQHHEIYPWSNLIRISAQEPQGKFVWEFSPDGMTIIEGTRQGDFLPIGLGAEDFAKAILDITTTPVRLLESKAAFIRGPSPVKVEGRWYYPIERVRPDKPGEPYRPKLVFYQNRDSSLVDMLRFASVDGGTFLAVRGYYYHEIEKGSVSVPIKVEIFKTDAAGFLQQRLVKIDTTHINVWYSQLEPTK